MTIPDQMSFFEHLDELRGRLIKSLVLWALLFIVCFIYSKELFQLLATPLIEIENDPNPWAAVDFKEPFMAHIKTAFWVSLMLASEIFFYHLWRFVGPGLTKSEKLFAIPFIFFMALLFAVGCWFSFQQVFPFALEYLISWNTDNVDAYTRTSYLSLLFAFVFGMGVSFEMPLVIFFLARLGLVTPQFLLAKFKYAVLLIFTLAAIITPTPDIYLQSALAIPMLVLYLAGVGAAYFVRKNKNEEPALEAPDTDEEE